MPASVDGLRQFGTKERVGDQKPFTRPLIGFEQFRANEGAVVQKPFAGAWPGVKGRLPGCSAAAVEKLGGLFDVILGVGKATQLCRIAEVPLAQLMAMVSPSGQVVEVSVARIVQTQRIVLLVGDVAPRPRLLGYRPVTIDARVGEQ